jgi:hypothetical protein
VSVLSALTWDSALVSHWFVGWLFSPICRFLDDLGGGGHRLTVIVGCEG